MEKQTRYSAGNSAYSAKSTAVACQIAIHTPGCQQPLRIQHISKRGRLLDFECTAAAAWDTRRRSANAELVTGAVVPKPLTHAGRAREVKSSADLTAAFCRSRRTPEGHRCSQSPKLQPKRHVSSSRTSSVL